MCGIIITKDRSKIPLISHRGIDYSFVERDDWYLGHHRLPIQTRYGDGNGQPIQIGDAYLLYNGEIFNYPKVYDSDVEYLIALFEYAKGDMQEVLREANKWDGFWSIVYVTKYMRHCFTDPLGKKQLYYNEKGEICSEIRPLMQNNPINKKYKSSCYKWGYVISDDTPWEGIKRIMPNQLYSFCDRIDMKRHKPGYFEWNSNLPKKELRELMFESVESRLISKKYSIGVLISGGIDSSIIASTLKSLGVEASYYTVENNESKYVDIISKHLGITPEYLDYDVKVGLEETLKWNETPVDLGSMVPQHKLFSVIPKKIVLSGDGADELFGGYKRSMEYDSQQSDVFEELPFYHLPRLDRASMRYTIELRNPFLSHDIVKYALRLPYSERINKKRLKDVFRPYLPKEIVDRKKLPLKNHLLVKDKRNYKDLIFNKFYNNIKWI